MIRAVILGVDPGASGALAALDPNTCDLLWVEDMPQHEGIVSAPLVADIVARQPVTVAWVENVHSMPKQGVSSSFKFGRAFGVVVGVLGGARVPVEYVSPPVWKRKAGLSKDKGASRRRAIEVWPAQSTLFSRVRDDGRAEAALIARHGWQQRNGERTAAMTAEPCCDLHQDVGCCDPDDCGPCCGDCPTCPTLNRHRRQVS